MATAADPDMKTAGKAAIHPPSRLPTLQNNALCKLFERADFTPAEVLAVGYERLRKIDGIGPKGLEIIAAWLSAHGLVLHAQEAARSERHLPHVERAIRLLQRHGYEIRSPAESIDPARSALTNGINSGA